MLGLVIVFEVLTGGSRQVFYWIWSALLFPFPKPEMALFTPAVFASWTLVFEMFFYGCFTFSLWVAQGRARWMLLALTAAMVTVGQFVQSNVPFVAYWGNPLVLEFMMGVLLSWWIGERAPDRRWSACLLVVGISVLAITAIIDVGPITEEHAILRDRTWAWLRVAWWGLPAATIVAGVAMSGWRPVGRFGKSMVLMGDACYSLYISQWMPLLVVTAAFPVVSAWLGVDAAILVGTMVCTASGFLIYWLIERPIVDRSTRWVEGRFKSGRTA